MKDHFELNQNETSLQLLKPKRYLTIPIFRKKSNQNVTYRMKIIDSIKLEDDKISNVRNNIVFQ